MKLLRLSARNWCQFGAIDIEFSSGLTGIRGPNGVGKSNLMNAVVYAVTGDFSRNKGIKVDNICQLAGEKDKAGVCLTMSHAEAMMQVTRNLRPNNQRLHIAGQKPELDLTGAKEIDAELTRIFEVNPRLLLDYVFVEQRQIFGFLDQDPGARLKAFTELFNAEKADVIWNAMGKHKIIVPVPSLDGDQVRLRLADHRNELLEIQRQQQAFAHLAEEWVEYEDPDYKLIEEYRLRQKLLRDKTTIQGLLTKLEREHTQTVSSLEQLEYEAQSLRAVVEVTQPTADAARAQLSAFKTYEAVAKTKVGLETRRASLQEELSRLQVPDKPTDYSEPDSDLQSILSVNRLELFEAGKFVQTFDPSNSTVKCPTCGTPTEHLQPNLEAAHEQIRRLKPLIHAQSERITLSKSYDLAIQRYETQLNNLLCWLTEVTTRLAEFTAVEVPAGDPVCLTQLLDDFQQVALTLSEAELKLFPVRSHKANLEGRLTSVQQQLAQTDVGLQQHSVTDHEATLSQERLALTKNAALEKQKLKLRYGHLCVLVDEAERNLAQLAKLEAEASILRDLHGHLEDVREVFKLLPKLAIQDCLNQLQLGIDTELARFDAPFRIHSISDLKFRLKKLNGVIIPAERLSVGERILFALAFRIVVNSKFAGSLGLLFLDEPTAGLDQDNLQCIAVALGRLRELSKSRGLQVVMITHDKDLDHLFDRVIELPVSA